MREAGPDRTLPGLSSWRWNAAALAVFSAALAILLGDVWRGDPRAAVPVGRIPVWVQAVGPADASFEAWLVDRHARTLVRAPWRLFDTEHCAPAPAERSGEREGGAG